MPGRRAVIATYLLLVGHFMSANAVGRCITPDRGEAHIPGGTFQMGSERYYEEEGPVRPVTVHEFWIDRFDVTNKQFAKFVSATGYITDAERRPNDIDYPDVPSESLSAGGAVFIPGGRDRYKMSNAKAGWEVIPGANWRHPKGPHTSIQRRDNEPVVQISYRDALAYAHWLGRDLPTEEQYEYAARGGLDGATYGWGDELKPNGKPMANFWQGSFPDHNTGEDGFVGLAPAGCFPANGYGLYDMIGNVWKWTASIAERQSPHNFPATVARVVKGGSFLCSVNYCKRFRPAARQWQESSFSSNHLGFRTIRNSPPAS